MYRIIGAVIILCIVFSCGNGNSEKDIFTPSGDVDVIEDSNKKPIGVLGNWKLIWNDEFKYYTDINPDNWSAENGSYRTEGDTYFAPEQVKIKDGLLILTADINRNSSKFGDAKYISGSVTTSDDTTYAGASRKFKQTFLYGVLEAKIKFPIDSGAWPSFWVMNSNYNWPEGGEIDIFEYYQSKIYLNIMHYVNSDKIWTSKVIRTMDLDTTWGNDFHIWSMERDESNIKLYLDGILVNHYETQIAQDDNFNPFHHPFFVILNLGIGGKSGGDASNIKFPIQMEVDWIRAFKKN